MLDAFIQLGMFTAKAIIIVVLILILLAGILAIIGAGKEKMRGRISLKSLNKKYQDTKDMLLEEVLPKHKFKEYMKAERKAEKKQKKSNKLMKNVFVLDFQGDIKASAVTALREEITAVLGIATKKDEVVVRLESAGGMVHAYGLAAAQLQRIRQHDIPLTVIVDKVAASGGYLMACVANKIFAAPFAIIGSIGVIMQLPNFNRLLKDKHIDFEQLTAGNFKRTLTMFGQNTPEGRDKAQQEIEEIHGLFKNLIEYNRPQLDIQKISTGEHWLGTQALELKLVDELKTSDDYLLAQSEHGQVYELHYCMKKSWGEKMASAVNALNLQSFLR